MEGNAQQVATGKSAIGACEMTYAILCFTAEDLATASWSQDQDTEIMARLAQVQENFDGRIACSARLLPTGTALSVRKGQAEAIIVDGPFVESKEHFLGFYIIECEGLDAATTFAEALMAANPWGSGYEVRPVRSFRA